jgi:hypothetical protein
MAYKMKHPYPKMGTVATSRKGKINPKSDSNLEDGREKSSAFQDLYKGGVYKKPGAKVSKRLY